ncbi:MAG: hypothetical protein WBW81_00435 [Methylocella sp.]
MKKIYVAKLGFRKQETNFVNLYGNDYLSMNFIYAALRGAGPEELTEAALQRFLLTVASIGGRKNQLRSTEAFAQSNSLPAAEAASRGLVPLIGGQGALREIAGGSALLVDPLNTDAIADAMRRAAHIGQADRQARLVRQTLARFSRNLAEAAAWRSALNHALAQRLSGPPPRTGGQR